jgi:hypothetical protein
MQNRLLRCIKNLQARDKLMRSKGLKRKFSTLSRSIKLCRRLSRSDWRQNSSVYQRKRTSLMKGLKTQMKSCATKLTSSKWLLAYQWIILASVKSKRNSKQSVLKNLRQILKQARIGQMASKKSCSMLKREILILSLRKKPSIFSMQDFKSVSLTLSSTRIHLLSFQLYWRIRERKN